MGNDENDNENENNPQMTRMDTDGGPLAEQRLNCSDYLSADVRQMLYGFSSVSNLFSICGLYWSASERGCGQELP